MIAVQHRLAVAGLLVTLGATVLACRLNLGGPPLPPAPPVSDLAATQASSAWSDALEDALATGQVTVILSESELTSAVAARLTGDDEALFHSPVVTLRDGVIQIYGVMQQGPVEANVRLAVTPVIEGDGRLGFDLTSADFGPLPAPDALRETVSTMLSEALAGPMGSLATGFRVTSVAVADGDLAIVAEVR
jgi:hypothetical protein